MAREDTKSRRQKISEDFLERLAKDFRIHGEVVIRQVREEMPLEYMKMVANLVPKEYNTNHNLSHEDALDLLDECQGD